ncbi:MAG: diguanylate cyclase [Ferrovum sp.]|nr:diguanylate cyclase [Ferrovum sp.]
MPDSLLKTALLQLPTQILHDLAEGKSPQDLCGAICRFAEGLAPGRITALMGPHGEGIARTFVLNDGPAVVPDPAILELLEFCSVMTETVLRYAQMQARVQHQHASLTRALHFNSMLAQVNQVIASAENAHTLFKAICEIAVQYGQMKLAFISEPYGDQRFKVLAAAGDTGYLEGLFISVDPDVPEGQGSMGQAWRDGRVRYNQSFAGTSHLDPWKAQAARFGFGASASLPILRQGSVTAILSVYHPQAHIFDQELRQLLEELSLNISRGLDRIFLRHRLTHEQDKQRYLTIHDALTGLPNRLALDQHLPGALARARKDQTLLAVCMADIDDFKHLNDDDQEAGDLVLKTVAQRLRSALRDTDLVARSGGDEFVLVIEGLLRYEDLFPRLERIREFLSAPIALPGRAPVTAEVSLGLTFYPNDGGDAGLLLRHAFEAMYGLKAYKGNRPSWWQIWGEGNLTSSAALPHSVPPYGAEAAALLAPLQESLTPLGRDFVARFQSEWARRPDISKILGRLDDDEFEALKIRLERHILMLQRPDLTEAEHRGHAAIMGRVNTLVGLELIALIDAIQAYHNQLRRRLHELQGMRLSEKQLVADIMAARLRVELESQVHALQHLLVGRQSWVARQSLRLSQATSWVDACRGFLEDVTQLQGCVAATINRPDTAGKLVYEFKTAALECYLRDLEAVGVVPHLMDAGGLPLPPAHLRVWQTEQIESNASYATEAHLAHLRQAALAAGIHSAIFVPITDHQGRVTTALGVFGGHPGQFESAETRLFFPVRGLSVKPGPAAAISSQSGHSVGGPAAAVPHPAGK